MSSEIAVEKSLLESRWFLVPVAMAVYLVALYVIRPFVSDWGWFIVGAHNVIFAAVGALIFLIVANRFGWLRMKPGQIAIVISIGLVFWALAESLWLAYESVGEDPFPSFADVFYLAAYIPFALALVFNIRTIHVKFTKPILIMWVALCIAALAGVTWAAIIPIAQNWTGLESIISLAYPVADFVIIALALVILLKFRSGEIAKPWGLLVIGFILQTIGDIWFAYAENTGTYAPPFTPYHPLDLVLTLGYLAILSSGLLFILTYRLRGGRKSA